jgi:hypothetical protein
VIPSHLATVGDKQMAFSFFISFFTDVQLDTFKENIMESHSKKSSVRA